MPTKLNTTLPADVQQLIEKLSSLVNWGAIAFLLINKKSWTFHQTHQAIHRSILFISLIYLFPSIELIPSKEVDTVWHQLLSDHITYEEVESIFNHKISHYPYAGLNGGQDRESLEQQFLYTNQLFLSTFGMPMTSNEQSEQSEPSGCILSAKAICKERPQLSIDVNPLEHMMT